MNEIKMWDIRHYLSTFCETTTHFELPYQVPHFHYEQIQKMQIKAMDKSSKKFIKMKPTIQLYFNI
jgi:hypothetical protein